MRYDIMKLMDNIEYGWKDKNGKIHYNADELFAKNYVLETPDEVLNNKIGICWDQVELERIFFDNNKINYKTFFLVYYDNDKCPTHTFLIYENNSSFYWFEHSWELFSGIHEYKSYNEALNDIKNKFIIHELNNICNEEYLYLYEYEKPEYGINCSQFYKHCEQGKNIK